MSRGFCKPSDLPNIHVSDNLNSRVVNAANITDDFAIGRISPLY